MYVFSLDFCVFILKRQRGRIVEQVYVSRMIVFHDQLFQNIKEL